MQASSDQLPTSFLLHQTMAESRRVWRERSADSSALRAVLKDIRTLLLRLQQVPCCVFTPDGRHWGLLCAYEDRLEHIGCPYVEADEYEGPELLSAAAFVLRDLGVMTEEERVAVATVIMAARTTLQDLDYAAQKGRKTLSVLQEGQSSVMLQKEAMRQEILQKIEEFLGTSA